MKAARVAQREAYNVLRQHGVIKDRARAQAESDTNSAPATHTDSALDPNAELEELASTCFAMHEIHGQAIAVTLATLRASSVNHLSDEDAAKVQALAEAMIQTKT